MGLGDSRVAPVRRETAHRVGGLLQLPRDVLEFPVAGLPRQPLQLPRRLLGLLGQVARGIAPAPLSTLLGRGPAALAFQLLLLAAGQLAQLLQRLIDLLVGGLLLAPLHGLVLVAQRIGLEFEEVGQVLRAGPPLAAPAAALLLLVLHRHEALVGLFGLLQLAQCALLGRDRAARAQGAQGVDGFIHGLHGDRQRLGDLLEGLVGPGDPAVHDPLGQRLHLGAQALLAVADADDVLLPGAGRVGVPVPYQVEAGRDDLPLQVGQILLHAVAAATAAATTASTTPALHLAVVAAVGTDLEEVDVGHRLAGHGGIVAGNPVVRDEVPDLEFVVLQEEGVPGGGLGERFAPRRVDAQRVGGSAVDAVDQEDLGDAHVVVGTGFDEHLLDRAHLDVAPGPVEGDGRPLVVEHVDPVVGCARHPGSAQGGKLHAVEAVLADGEGALEGSLRPGFQLDRVARVHHQPGFGHGNGGRDDQLDPGPGERGHVAAVLEAARRQPGVAREVVDHFKPVYRGEIRDAEGEGAGADPVGLDVVGGLLRDVEEEAFMGAGAVLDHRQGGVAGLSLGAGVQDDIFGVEAVRDGADHEVGVPRDDGVAGFERDAVGVDRLGRADGEEERVHAVPQEAGAERKEQEGGEGQAAERRGRAPDRLRLDALAVVDAATLPRGALHHLLQQLRVVEAAVAGRLHRGHDLGVEGGFVFLQVQRDPFVGNPAEHRPEDRVGHEEADHQPEHDAQCQDRLRLEAQRLQGGCGDEKGQERTGNRQGESAQQKLEPPASANPAYDAEKLIPVPRVAPD